MNIKILSIGKTDDKTLDILVQNYINRLKHYINIEFIILPDLKNRKNLSIEQQKILEGDLLLKNLQSRSFGTDYVIVLDEKGQQLTSMGFSKYLTKKMVSGAKQIVFIIGGPYGFSEAIYLRANEKMSLSKMTFSHQMVRLFFVEQLYRAFTIIKNEPYHHE